MRANHEYSNHVVVCAVTLIFYASVVDTLPDARGWLEYYGWNSPVTAQNGLYLQSNCDAVIRKASVVTFLMHDGTYGFR